MRIQLLIFRFTNYRIKCRKVFYGEYECIGPGANNTSRVSFAKQLNESEAAPFMDVSYIDGNEWLLYTPLFNLHEDDYIPNDQFTYTY